MHANSTTLRLILVLAALSLHATPLASANAVPASTERFTKQSRSAVQLEPLQMGRTFKRVARVVPVAAPLSKRRKHEYNEDEEDYENEDEEEADEEEEAPDRRARQYLSADDSSDGFANPGRAASNALANSPSDSDDADEVIANPDGNVQIRSSILPSPSATSDLLDTASLASLARATLARATSTSASSESEPIATSSLARKVRPTTDDSTTSPSPTTENETLETTITTSLSSTTSQASPTSTSSSSRPRVTSSSTGGTSSQASQTASASSDDKDNDEADNAAYTGVWSTFNKNSRWFPVAIVLTVLIGIAALVITVALLQCIARSPRFSKKKERPMLIPSDSSWGGSETSRRSSLLSEKRASIASLPTSRVASTIGAHRNRDTYTAFPARPAAPSHRSSDASLVKEDFLPHSYDPEPETAQVTDIYPALSRLAHLQPSTPSRRGTPAPAVYPYLDTVPTIQRMEPAAYPYSAPYALSSSPAPSHFTEYRSSVSRLPSILTPGRTPRPSLEDGSPLQSQPRYQMQNQRIRPSHSIASSGVTDRRSQYGPRPGRDERQSVPRASLNEQMLSQQLGRKAYNLNGIPEEPPRLPVGVMERRPWERCST